MTTSEPTPNAHRERLHLARRRRPRRSPRHPAGATIDSIEKPSSLGTCEMITSSATAFRYPTRIGLDSRSVTKPEAQQAAEQEDRADHDREQTRERDRTARHCRAREAGSDAAMMGASAESGPSTRMRDGPNTAYASRGTIVAYRPVSGGQSGGDRVAHAGGDQQRRHDDAGADVGPQPRSAVLASHGDAGQPPGDPLALISPPPLHIIADRRRVR